jgi:hypothetical protein
VQAPLPASNTSTTAPPNKRRNLSIRTAAP